jgi:hypothetical protein
MIESLILELPDWTTKTSFSRTLVRILTLVSPFTRSQVSQSLSRKQSDGNQQGSGTRRIGSSRGKATLEAHICELGQLSLARLHAQVLADLASENGNRVPGKDESVAHGDFGSPSINPRQEGKDLVEGKSGAVQRRGRKAKSWRDGAKLYYFSSRSLAPANNHG